MQIFLVLLAAVPSGDTVELLASHQHEKVYIWIKNHSSAEVTSLRVRVTAEGYDKEHDIWDAKQPPVEVGKAKRATLTIPAFDKIKQRHVSARVVMLNGTDIPLAPQSKPKVPSPPKPILVYVDRVLDGDTLQIHDEHDKRYTVRLHGIDAPENSQAFGLDSRNLLGKLTIGKTLKFKLEGTDRYQRKLGVLYDHEGRDVNLIMLQKGMAWHYVKYSKSETFARAEATARKARTGLWSQPKRIAPWDYRNGVRLETPMPRNAPSIRTTDKLVYITETGKKYHRGGCRYLDKSKQQIPLSRAKSAYGACKVCNPPSQ